jgi:hypothetical protein
MAKWGLMFLKECFETHEQQQPLAGELHEGGCFAAGRKVAHDWTFAPPAGENNSNSARQKGDQECFTREAGA